VAETVGLLILSALAVEASVITVASVAISTATVVGTIALTAASVGIGLLMSPSNVAPNIPTSQEGTQTLKQPIPPRIFGYGRCRIAGAYMFFETTDPGGDSYDVIALHHGKIGAIIYHYLHDDLVLLDGTGLVTSVVGEASLTRYDPVIIKTRLGLATETHYSEVATAFPSFWTSAHDGHGQASLMLKCPDVAINDYWDRYPHGLPKPSVVADLTAIFDPRDATQSLGSPSTWKVSRNPVLQIIDLLTSEDHGLGLDYATLIAPVLTQLMARADECDEPITLKFGGTEPRYASSGWAYLTTDPIDILVAMLLTCDGWLAEGPDGTLALWVGKYNAPTITLTDDHIFGFTMDCGTADEEAVNEIRFRYTPSLNDYREAPGVPWQDTADIAERGRIRSQQLGLTWVESHSQCLRLAKRQMARYQASRRGTMVCSLYALRCLGQRWVRVQSNTIDDLGNAVVEISRLRVDLASAKVSFDWALVNPNAIDAWDPATEEATPPVFPGKLSLLALPTPTNVVLDSVGGEPIPFGRIRIRFDDPHRPDLNFTARYREVGIGFNEVDKVYSSFESDGTTVTLYLGAAETILAGKTYEVKVASRNALGVLSTFSTYQSIAV
jgi:hypothetical protein